MQEKNDQESFLCWGQVMGRRRVKVLPWPEVAAVGFVTPVESLGNTRQMFIAYPASFVNPLDDGFLVIVE